MDRREDKHRSAFIAFTVTVAALLSASAPSHAATYTATLILPSPGNAASAYAINDAGRVAGQWIWDANNDPDTGGVQAMSWFGASSLTLNALHGHVWSLVAAINNQGTVLGKSCSGTLVCNSVVWSGAEPTDLGTTFDAAAINDSGELVGTLYPATGLSKVAAIRNSSVSALPAAPNSVASTAAAVNQAGDVVGTISLNDGKTYGALWRGGGAPKLLGAGFYPRAINASDVIGGELLVAGTSHAAIWNNDILADVGTLGGAASRINAIDASGVAFGWADDSGGHQLAAQWLYGKSSDLNKALATKLPSGLALTSANAVDSSGRIVCEAGFGNPIVLLSPPGAISPTAPPVITSNSGVAPAIQVTMLDSTPGATIYYTTDGSNPIDDGTNPDFAPLKYVSPFTVYGRASLRAVAIANGFASSGETDASFAGTPADTGNVSVSVNLGNTYNVIGIGTPGAPIRDGGIDGAGDRIHADTLDATVRWDGATFAFNPAGILNAILSKGNVITLPAGRFTNVQLLAFGVKGNQINQPFLITYTDGTTSVIHQSLSDWGGSATYTGETAVVTMHHRITRDGTTSLGPYTVYGYTMALDSSRTVKSLTLPSNTKVAVLGAALQPVPAAPPPTSVAVDFSGSASLVGLAKDSTTIVGGGADRQGGAYSSALLGTSLLWSGTTFQFGPPGTADAVSAATIALPAGYYADLKMLGTAVNGAQLNQRFVVTYTDNTTTEVTLSLSDWHFPNFFTGESISATETYRLVASGAKKTGPYYLYGYDLPLDPTKVLKSITLPANRNVVIVAMTLELTPPPTPTQHLQVAADLSKIANVIGISSYHQPAGASTDIFRTYQLNGYVAEGTIDSTGAYGAPGADISGSPFSASMTFDRTTAASYPEERTGPLVSGVVTVNGATQIMQANSTLDVTFYSDSYIRIVGGSLYFLAENAGYDSFLVTDTPGVHDLTCRFGSFCNNSVTYTFTGLSFASTLNNLTITDRGAVQIGTNSGLDAMGNAYDSTFIGPELDSDGVSYAILPPSQLDAVAAATVTLPPGSFSTLHLLGTGVQGNHTNIAFTVQYQDGTSTSILQSLSDWHTPQHYDRESIAIQMPSKLKYNGTSITGPYYLYSYALPIDPTKTVKNVVLPTNRFVTVLAITLTP